MRTHDNLNKSAVFGREIECGHFRKEDSLKTDRSISMKRFEPITEHELPSKAR